MKALVQFSFRQTSALSWLAHGVSRTVGECLPAVGHGRFGNQGQDSKET
jgi:hypothetical protein